MNLKNIKQKDIKTITVNVFGTKNKLSSQSQLKLKLEKKELSTQETYQSLAMCFIRQNMLKD